MHSIYAIIGECGIAGVTFPTDLASEFRLLPPRIALANQLNANFPFFAGLSKTNHSRHIHFLC